MKTLIAALAVAAACGGAAVAEPLRATAAMNCRETPSLYGKVVAAIAKGAIVDGKASAGDWTRIDGAPDCWAATRYLVKLDASAKPGASAKPDVRPGTASSRTSSYRISKPRRLSPAASERASRRATPNEPLFSPRGLNPRACPCGSLQVCIGPRGGRYCITSGGNKRYGV